MPRRRGDTRREILAVAGQLLQQRGYHGFSYQHVAEALDLRTAAVHYHFPAKADLGIAVVAGMREDFRWWSRQVGVRRLSGAERVERFLELESRYVSDRKVCPLGVAGVEFEGLPAGLRAEATKLLDDVAAFLESALVAGERDGSLCFDGRPGPVALQVLAATQGALQIGRLRGQAGYRAVTQALRASLGIAGHAPTRVTA